MPNDALIIFSRNPLPGKVKSRLAEAIGEKEALSVYRQLLHHTYYITHNLPVDKYVYYSDFINNDDLWESNSYFKELQTGRTLGDKLLAAFENMFFSGYRKCVIIGSESIEIEATHIEQAFSLLDNHDVVIGPAQTGGYYLVGLNKLFEPMFTDKPWGTNKLVLSTIQELDSYNMSYHLLPLLSDIDEEKELYLLHHRQ
ncbi:TIGR04282 family arsenosugar biosynthesis glycosyltransferase [Foetidibacter luteolus]|uniref:TIGR04282 family arsenosugar biosynthesis glycosyltransferase n=1 Tax=Foetidibacter luteolus TaxID=2608880 RepID=UPI00129B42C1|nr:TIGR04282 family arsenosugar biosynthesis glycosyltransferase [Foetidibacter luteolus]